MSLWSKGVCVRRCYLGKGLFVILTMVRVVCDVVVRGFAMDRVQC